MRVSILQTDIAWEDKQTNLDNLHHSLKELQGKTDLVILPEMCTTGFSMKSQELAEPISGETMTILRLWANTYQIAIAGSYIACEKDTYYNRAFFITPENTIYSYDKKHLFRMGDEGKYFSAGENRKPIIHYRGWKICILICYEVRFPVWSRNVNNEYDLLIYVANWPTPRRHVWNTLLTARAIENVCYVCGANRVGIDGNKLSYNGGSAIYSPKGETVIAAPDNEVSIITTELNIEELKTFREKFPVWKDADKFCIEK